MTRGADRAAHLQVKHGQGDVLRVALVEDPDLAVGGRPRHAVPVVVEQHALALRAPGGRWAAGAT